jgi:chemotaxis protein methyltransferase CheR
LSFRSIAEFLNEKYSKTCNIKLWSAGCSSGEEVYSMAILLERLGLLNISIVYATDFNKAILEDAKNGVYSKETCELGLSNYNEVGLDDELSNYVINHDKFVIIKNYIREKVNFFQHNLVIDGSFNEFDIIICKNVLIYFDDNLQQVVFQLFYDSLKFGGYLVLGKSEMVHVSFADKFQRYKDDSKIFKKVA